MDAIEKEKLLLAMGDFGYPLISSTVFDLKETLLQIVRSDEHRILEGFPVVMSNVLAREKVIDLQEVEAKLHSASLRKRLHILCAVTHYLATYWRGGEELQGVGVLDRYLRHVGHDIIDRVTHQMTHDDRLAIGGNVVLSPERLRKTYTNYVLVALQEQKQRQSEQIENRRMRAFHDALRELFAEKQAEIVLKSLRNEELTKTEREYFSRVIKRKLRAITNHDLQITADALLGVR
jgi:hypothetical protein